MTCEEKLTAIAAKCRELLALAEKRTEGKWVLTGGCVKADQCTVAYPPRMTDALPRGGINDGLFIAACAGAAEAGWRATLTAIDMLSQLPSPDSSLIENQIIAAWEGQY